jgi:DNA ligase-1
LDGIRCLTLPHTGGLFRCNAVSRKFKPIPNAHIRDWVETHLPAGLDGELMIVAEDGSALPFQATTSGVMKHTGTPCFQYHVFDYCGRGLDTPYTERLQQLQFLRLPRGTCKLVLPVLINNVEELLAFEAKCLAEGYEGVMVRTPDGPYKEGRSTVREQWLLKVKRFKDDEGYVCGAEEARENTNEAGKDELGHTKRSTAKAGMRGKGHAGSFIVKPCTQGAPTAADFAYIKENEHRLDAALAAHPYLFSASTSVITKGKRFIPMSSVPALLHRMVVYKHQPTGVLVKPRFPVIKGYRDAIDIGEPEQD